MTDTICQILGLHEPDPHTAASTNLVTNDYFGIEIEVESIVRNQPNVPSWKCVHDGSLRNNGQEFIFAGPTCGIKAVTALRELDKALCNNTGAECNDRTSTHVHVDVRDLTPKQLKTFLLLSIMFEEVFMRKTGNRANNSFCCRFAVSDAQLKAVSAIGDMRKGHIPDALREVEKYASVNMLCMFNFGSIEFRYHDGTFDSNAILDWVNTLLSMKKFSREREINPEQLTEIYSMEGGLDLFHDVVGDYLYSKYYDDDTDEFLKQGMRLCQDAILLNDLAKNQQRLIKVVRHADDNWVSPRAKLFFKHVRGEDYDEVFPVKDRKNPRLKHNDFNEMIQEMQKGHGDEIPQPVFRKVRLRGDAEHLMQEDAPDPEF